MSSQDEVIYKLKQKVASLEEENYRAFCQIEELRSENEKLKQLSQEKEGTFVLVVNRHQLKRSHLL